MSDDILDEGLVIDLLFGRWRSQIIHAAVKLNIFEQLADGQRKYADELAKNLACNEEGIYRLMRALASMRLIKEMDQRMFSIEKAGLILCANHPNSLRSMVLLEEGATHYDAWRYLSDVVKSGGANGFVRAHKTTWDQYIKTNQEYADLFGEAMSSFSANEAPVVAEALSQRGFKQEHPCICDIGGGDGLLVSYLLTAFPAASGIVFDLPEVCDSVGRRKTATVRNRVSHVGGNMFESVPMNADLYILKHIVHDWDDTQNKALLSTIARHSNKGSTLLIAEQIIPEGPKPHFSKIFDVHMMVVSEGRQRTASHVAELLSASGWRLDEIITSENHPMSCLFATRT